MLLLGELVNRVGISAGQLVIPLSDLELDYTKLEQLFLQTLNEYQKWKPDFRQQEIYVDPAGIILDDATRVVTMRPFVFANGLYEFTKTIKFNAFQLNSNKLTAAYAGKYFVEYFARYRKGNLIVIYDQTDVTEFETDFKFNIKGHFKKGTFFLKLKQGSTTYQMKEDMSSYKVISSTLSYDTGTDIFTIQDKLGSKLQTGSRLTVKSSYLYPVGLAEETTYFVIRISDTTIKLAETIEDAYEGTEIDISAIVPDSSSFTVDDTDASVSEAFYDLLSDGFAVDYSNTGTDPTGLTDGETYYVKKETSPVIALYASENDALTDTDKIDIGSLTGTHTLTYIASSTLTIESITDEPLVYLLGDLGWGSVDLNTLETNIVLADSFTGILKVYFTSLFLAVDDTNSKDPIGNDTLFFDLFQANLMMSLGLIKEILKLPDLPFDFSADSIHDRGKKLKEETMEQLIDQSSWYLFR